MLHFFSPPPLPSPFPSFLCLENHSGACYIKNWKLWKTSAKIGQTASILSCTVHWLMSGAGHYLSRHRKFALSSLSCQYGALHTKYQTGIHFHWHRPVIYIFSSFGWHKLVTLVKLGLLCLSWCLTNKVTCFPLENDRSCVSPCMHTRLYMHQRIWWDSRKGARGYTGQEERRLHNVFWKLEGLAGPRCQPASRYGASFNRTDNGEADTRRQHAWRARTKNGSGGKKGNKEGRTVPPRLSLSAGFTWIGLFICDIERRKQETKNPVSIM